MLTSLDALVQGNLHDSLPIAANDPRLVAKAMRDRLVIYSPACAPLLRPALAAADLRRWQHAPSTRFLIAMPRGWTQAIQRQADVGHRMADDSARDERVAEDAGFAALAERFPLLAKQLVPHREELQAAPHGDFWWELPPYPVDMFTTPAIIWAHAQPLQAAPAPGGAYLLEGMSFTTAPSVFLLGALNSQRVRLVASHLPDLSAAQVARLRIPEPAEATQQRIGECAEQAGMQAQSRIAIDQHVVTRVLRDLAPPGATAGPLLATWWQLSFEDFLVELAQRFKSDVPFRYRDGWRTYWREQRIARQICDATIAQLEAEIDALIELRDGKLN